MDQTIKKGFPKNWLMINWIKPIYKGEYLKFVSNYRFNVVISIITIYIVLSWNKRLAHGLNIITNKHLVNQAFDQKNPLSNHLVILKLFI